MDPWSVYIIRCRNGSLYTGVATDVARRLGEHEGNGGRGARYLRGRGPLELVLQHAVGDRGLALRLEQRIKKLPKKRKEELLGHHAIIRRLVAEADGRPSTSREVVP